MADLLKKLKSSIEEKKAEKKLSFQAEDKSPEREIDLSQVDKIVEKMQKRSRQAGAPQEELTGELGELKEIISGSEKQRLELSNIEDLKDFQNPMIRRLGNLYLAFRLPMNIVGGLVSRLPQTKLLNYYLYSANMKYSAKQWIALTAAAAIVVLIVSLIGGVSLTTFVLSRLPPLHANLRFLGILLPVVISIFLFFLAIVVMGLIPSTRAKKRGEEVSVELPFALRHMATELRAGIGLYKTIETIAKSDYGVLSEEFSRTIREIEEGTDTKEALIHFAARSQSAPLKNSLRHLIRALKTGGNLSDIMSTIAADVSFDLRMKVRDYAEKLNFFGVIFIFMGIVMPVFLGIIGGIVNAPLGLPLNFPLPPITILLVYLVLMPTLLTVLAYYLKITQPRV